MLARRETQTWKVLRFSIPIGTRDEPDDLRAHASPSHTAIATRPATASAIKYTVMPASSAVNQLCGMIAVLAIISGANPIPPSAIRMADRPIQEILIKMPAAGFPVRALKLLR